MWRRLQAIPGVTSVGASTALTISPGGTTVVVGVEDFPPPAGQYAPVRQVEWITGDYFEAMQNPILAGRSIEWSAVHARSPVAVVTESFAEEHWGDPTAALGKRISYRSAAS